jgi:predicted TIM-barrel fold metal-dependent hydrolase
VNYSNYRRIRSALAKGSRDLAAIRASGSVEGLRRFYKHTLRTHQPGKRPDVDVLNPFAKYANDMGFPGALSPHKGDKPQRARRESFSAPTSLGVRTV